MRLLVSHGQIRFLRFDVLRLLRGDGSMRLSTAFDPIDAGEQDDLVFDLTVDVGASTINSVIGKCTLESQESSDADGIPALRILNIEQTTSLDQVSAFDGSTITKTGQFVVIRFGNLPISAIGAWYVVEATAHLGDGRVLKRSSTIQCQPQG